MRRDEIGITNKHPEHPQAPRAPTVLDTVNPSLGAFCIKPISTHSTKNTQTCDVTNFVVRHMLGHTLRQPLGHLDTLGHSGFL